MSGDFWEVFYVCYGVCYDNDFFDFDDSGMGCGFWMFRLVVMDC